MNKLIPPPLRTFKQFLYCLGYSDYQNWIDNRDISWLSDDETLCYLSGKTDAKEEILSIQ